MDPVSCETDLTADPPEAGTCVVRDILLGKDAALDLPGEALKRIQTVEQVEENVVLRLGLLPVITQGGDPFSSIGSGAVNLHAPDVVKKRRQMQKLCGCQSASDRERAKGISEVPVAAKIHISLSDQELQGSVRLLLGKADVR